MNFAVSDEQKMIIQTVKTFVEKELMPYEDEVERLDEVPEELRRQIRDRAIEQGLYAVNMPEELGGGGVDNVTLFLIERELFRTNFALQSFVYRPSNILRACKGSQVERYLKPSIAGERMDCIAMTEPDAGSDLRGMKARATPDGDDYIINGVKHFISHADVADYCIVFAATGEEMTPRGLKKKMTAFFVDKGTPGFSVKKGYDMVSHRGYHNSILEFDDCRVPAENILGEVDKGFDTANDWLGATRLQVAATAVGRAWRAYELAADWAATREQFGQKIGKFQGVSFKLADMYKEIKASELLCLECAWKHDQGTARDMDFAVAKLHATEMLAMVSDEAIQIFGGMGLASENKLERIWRDARVERIWEGTSEIQRHIISRSILRPLEAKQA